MTFQLEIFMYSPMMPNFTLCFNVNVSSPFLTLKNEVVLVSNHGNISLIISPKTPYVLVLVDANSTFSMTIFTNSTYTENTTTMRITLSPVIYVSTNSTIQDEKINVGKGYWYVEINVDRET